MPYVNTYLSDSEPGKNEVQVYDYSAEACGMPCWSKDLVRCIGQLSTMRRKSLTASVLQWYSQIFPNYRNGTGPANSSHIGEEKAKFSK